MNNKQIAQIAASLINKYASLGAGNKKSKGTLFSSGFYFIKDTLDVIGISKEDQLPILRLILSFKHYHVGDIERLANVSDEFRQLLLLTEEELKSVIDFNLSIADIEPVEMPLVDKNKKLVAMCGPIGVGKSTYVKNHFSDWFIVSRDEILEKFAKERYGDLPYTELFALVRENKQQSEVDELLAKKIEESKCYNKVVIDMVNLFASKQKFISNQYEGWDRTIIILNPGAKSIIQRNEKRKKNGKCISRDIVVSTLKRIVHPDTTQWEQIRWEVE